MTLKLLLSTISHKTFNTQYLHLVHEILKLYVLKKQLYSPLYKISCAQNHMLDGNPQRELLAVNHGHFYRLY